MKKHIELENSYNDKHSVEAQLLILGEGDIFGEEKLLFNRDNTYSVTASTQGVNCVVANTSQFATRFRKVVPVLKCMLRERGNLVASLAAQEEHKIAHLKTVAGPKIIEECKNTCYNPDFLKNMQFLSPNNKRIMHRIFQRRQFGMLH